MLFSHDTERSFACIVDLVNSAASRTPSGHHEEQLPDLASLAADLAPAPPRAAGVVRIRKPRWTPSLPLGEGLPDIVADDVTDEKTGEKSK